MIAQSLELQIASNHVDQFVSGLKQFTPIVSGSKAFASKSLEGGAFLRSGIEAYKWLARAEESLVAADTMGVNTWTNELDNAFRRLYLRWLDSSEKAKAWIADQSLSSDIPRNLVNEFHQCQEAVEDWLERDERNQLSRAALEGRFSEEEAG